MIIILIVHTLHTLTYRGSEPETANLKLHVPTNELFFLVSIYSIHTLSFCTSSA